MKTLEKKVHFTAEGTSVVCYDSKGIPMVYLMIDGEPYIKIDNSVDRLLSIDNVAVHSGYLEYYTNHRSDIFGHCNLAGVINGVFVNSKNALYRYAERPCSRRELASFYLAKYKAQKNLINMMEVKNG